MSKNKANKNEKQICPYCGKKSAMYVPAIGWECTNRKCYKERQNNLIADFNSKGYTDAEKVLMFNGVSLSHKDHILLHNKNAKKD